jgi:hypothetical protein
MRNGSSRKSVGIQDRDQILGACELALTALLAGEKDTVVDFVRQQLKLSGAWLTVVGQALLDKDRHGNYRWEAAENPIGLIRTIARRNAGKTDPELLNLPHQTSVNTPAELPLSQVSTRTGRSKVGPDSESTGGAPEQVLVDRLSFESASEIYRPTATESIGSDLRCDDDVNSPFDYDWAKIGTRLGWSEDETVLLKARASGTSRVDAERVLGWDKKRVERVWRAISRMIEDPATAKRARTTLLS